MERLKTLCRHQAYCFWDKDGKAIYLGQTTMGGVCRFSQHFSEALKAESKSGWPFKLHEALETGIYAKVVVTGLGELRVNDFEKLGIDYIKSDPKMLETCQAAELLCEFCH